MAFRNGRSGVSTALRRTLLALVFAAIPQPLLAQPPSPGAIHTFLDPVFQGTVFCDTLAEVRAIATAVAPHYVYQAFRMAMNEHHEPVCMSIIPTGLVVEITPIGTMVLEGHRFNAWAVETLVGGITAFALYLEYVEQIGL